MNLRTIEEAEIKKGQRVLVRVDFDVAMRDGRVDEDFRLRAILPTVRFISKKRGRIRFIAHLDRPGGKVIPAYSFKKILGRLEKLLKRRVVFIQDPFSEKLLAAYNSSEDILLLENMRFWSGEEANDEGFAKSIGRWGDIYINDAFANSHRKHASMVSLAKILPSFAGLALEGEVRSLSAVSQNPAKPFYAILGGAKLETKLPLIKVLLDIADGVLIGGALVSSVRDFVVGRNLVKSGITKKEMGDLKSNKLHMPSDVKVARNSNRKGRITDINKLSAGEVVLDIGPETVKTFVSLLKDAKTVVWNGPLGLAEKKEFSAGTVGIAKGLQRIEAFKLVGGGDTIAILRNYKVLKGFNHISLGGGAMLDFLSGSKLPGLEILKK